MHGQSYRILLPLLLLPLAGCIAFTSAHGHRHAPAEQAKSGSDAGEDTGGTQTVAMDTDPRLRPGDDPEPGDREHGGDPDSRDGGDSAQPFSADPHSERPGTTEDRAPPPEARAVAFVAPEPGLRPVRADRRPTLPARAVLALATVHEGQVVLDSEAVLALDQLLAKESALANVVGLEPPPSARASLKDLAKAAYAGKRHLLLVDVRPWLETEKRVGFLLDARTGSLLARWTIEPEGSGSTPASSGSPSDLCERLARSYVRLTR